MSLYFITGIAGSGKSTVKAGMVAAGYEAYDTDEDGFARWQNLETGYVHPKSSVKAAQRTPEFLASHEWIVPRASVEKLAQAAESKPVFLCGEAKNVVELTDLFTEIFDLIIDRETLRHRLETRTTGDWGKQPHELQLSLDRLDAAQTFYHTQGYTLIDANKLEKDAIDDIISSLHE